MPTASGNHFRARLAPKCGPIHTSFRLKRNPELETKKARIAAGLDLIGAGERNRTLDLLITNELLYRLSYTGGKRRTLF